ncbi:MAG: hypothetical protein KatS3mg105_2593 [Gemmatales bacterium]|nr:MAG: hypothetical protein KatS3mg105_2593 [Gemmatales bacterium]
MPGWQNLFRASEDMMDSKKQRKRGRHYMVAMVLGCALTASASAAAQSSPIPPRTIEQLARYCTACWRNAGLDPQSWADCTHEVFCRLLQRVEPPAWENMLRIEGPERAELVRAIDTVKKRIQRQRRRTTQPLTIAVDARSARERRLAEEREAVQQVARHILSNRQHRILELSLEGWSVREIAEKLQVPAARISDEKYKAIQKLQKALHA